MHICLNWCEFSQLLLFPKVFYGLADIPTLFRREEALESKHLAWLDNIIIVTKGSKEQQKELIDVLTRLENAGYSLSENKSEIFKSEIEWIGHQINQNGIEATAG